MRDAHAVASERCRTVAASHPNTHEKSVLGLQALQMLMKDPDDRP
jgi:hypothetical protein